MTVQLATASPAYRKDGTAPVRRILRQAQACLRDAWPGALALLLCGCGEFSESLKYDQRLLVKVKRSDRVIEAQADGWKFRHLVEAPHDGMNDGQWYVAWRDTGPRTEQPLPLGEVILGHLPIGSIARARYWESVRRDTPELARATQHALRALPMMIEPNLVFSQQTPNDGSPEQKTAGAVPRHVPHLAYGKGPSAVWPSAVSSKYGPLWHLDDQYSQLGSAREEVRRAGRGTERVRIGILDNGFARQQAGMPLHLMRDPLGDANGWVQGVPQSALVEPGNAGSTHGTGTIGILAGGKVRITDAAASGHIPEFHGYLGGAPAAEIVPVRIAPWVLSVETASMAYGIDYASRQRGCQVLSISHGGAPSQVWVDAVNAAYDRGTAMFAAEGDFYRDPFSPFAPRGFVVPETPVYPAAFRRVIGVTGVTQSGQSYATNSLLNLLRHPADVADWFARGSYGPDGWRRNLISRDVTPDGAEKRLGSLRAWPIAAYSPNIPWLAAPDPKNPPKDGLDRVDLDGSGTSAATPQVAAAAALWMQRHLGEIPAKDRGTWKQAEAAYEALLISASRTERPVWPDKYLGAGTLRARDALKWSYASVQRLHGSEVEWGRSGRDWFDGSRSLTSLFARQPDEVPFKYRAILDQCALSGESLETQMTRLYFNTLLLEEWHKDRLPQKGAEEARLWAKAAKLATGKKAGRSFLSGKVKKSGRAE